MLDRTELEMDVNCWMVTLHFARGAAKVTFFKNKEAQEYFVTAVFNNEDSINATVTKLVA